MATEGYVQVPPDSTGKQLRTVSAGIASPSTVLQHVQAIADPEGFLAKVSAFGALQVEAVKQRELLTLCLVELRRIGLLMSVLAGTEISNNDLLEAES